MRIDSSSHSVVRDDNGNRSRRGARTFGWVLAGAALCIASAAGCSSDKGKDGAATGSTGDDGTTAAPSFFGEEAAFERAVVGADYMSALTGAGPHNPEEPDFFDANWVARESHDQLERAKHGEFTYRQVSTSNRMPCLVFDDHKLVRRMLVGSGKSYEPLEEMSFSREGKLILWFRSDRGNPTTTLEWAYFHHGQNLSLYQRKVGSESRSAPVAPRGLDNAILSTVNDCLARFGATNPRLSAASVKPPTPVVKAPPPPAQPPPPPPPPAQPAPEAPAPPPAPPVATNTPEPGAAGDSGKIFGAIAYSKQHNRWGVAAQRASDADAQEAALIFCGKLDCEVAAVFGRGQCAVVMHTATTGVSWGYGDSADGARGFARRECEQRGGGCTEQGLWCNEP